MLLTAVRDEFTFYNEFRKLSPKTVKNYRKQIDYFLRYLEHERVVARAHIEYVDDGHTGIPGCITLILLLSV